MGKRRKRFIGETANSAPLETGHSVCDGTPTPVTLHLCIQPFVGQAVGTQWVRYAVPALVKLPAECRRQTAHQLTSQTPSQACNKAQGGKVQEAMRPVLWARW